MRSLILAVVVLFSFASPAVAALVAVALGTSAFDGGGSSSKATSGRSDLVAGGVAITVVQRFEIVQIQEHQRVEAAMSLAG